MLWLVGLLRFMAKPQAFEGTRVGFHGERVAFACGRRTTRSRKGTGGLTDQIFFVVLSLLLGGPPVTAAVVARAVGPGPPPQSFPKPSAESAAPVLPPAPTSRWISAYMLGICVLVCAAFILVTQAAAPETQPTPASSDVPEAPAAGSGLQAVRTSQAAGSTPLETGEPRSVPAQAPTVLDRATPTGLTQAIAPYLEGASVEVLATCFAEKWSREQRQRLLVLVEHRAAAAHAEAEAERTTSREVRKRSEVGLAPSAMLPSDTSTVSAPKGAPPPGRPQRKVSTKVPEASVRTESGNAEPKLDNIRSLFTTYKTHNFPCI